MFRSLILLSIGVLSVSSSCQDRFRLYLVENVEWCHNHPRFIETAEKFGLDESDKYSSNSKMDFSLPFETWQIPEWYLYHFSKQYFLLEIVPKGCADLPMEYRTVISIAHASKRVPYASGSRGRLSCNLEDNVHFSEDPLHEMVISPHFPMDNLTKLRSEVSELRNSINSHNITSRIIMALWPIDPAPLSEYDGSSFLCKAVRIFSDYQFCEVFFMFTGLVPFDTALCENRYKTTLDVKEPRTLAYRADQIKCPATPSTTSTVRDIGTNISYIIYDNGETALKKLKVGTRYRYYFIYCWHTVIDCRQTATLLEWI